MLVTDLVAALQQHARDRIGSGAVHLRRRGEGRIERGLPREQRDDRIDGRAEGRFRGNARGQLALEARPRLGHQRALEVAEQLLLPREALIE